MPRIKDDNNVVDLAQARNARNDTTVLEAKPSDVLWAMEELGFDDEVAVDTETSGLFADDGARVSTASIAWQADPERGWDEWANRWSNVTYGWEQIAPDGTGMWIASIAWPFDQGTEGKPEDDGQIKLWPDADNLPMEEWQTLLTLLEGYLLDMHNGKFDLEKFRVGVRRWPGVGLDLEKNLIWDSQNVNDLLWRLHPTSLKPTCQRLFGKEWADEAGVVKKYLQKAKLPAGRWDLMPWSAIGKYADTDARITLMLKHRQVWEIESNGAGSWLYYPEGGLAPGIDPKDGVYDAINRRLDFTKEVLYRMERRGVPYDEVTSREAGFECRDRAKQVAAKLPFSKPTLTEAKDFFFGEGDTDRGIEKLGRVPYSVTDKGAPQLTAEIAARMVDDRVPYADTWAEYTKVTNAASMWYEGYADAVGPDGRIRCAFRQNGTRSTRISVERINLQAIPQNYRLSEFSILDGIPTPRQIIANSVPEGWKIFELDLAQAELRLATMIAGCKLMDEMIREDADLHTFTTLALFPEIPESDPLFKSKWRQVGKRGNFSLCFGSGGPTFKRMVSKETGIMLEDHEAIRIVRDWNALYPEFGVAINKHMRVVEKRQSAYGFGWIDLVTRERRWFQEYEEAHKAFNQRVQANLGQFALDWNLMTERFLYSNPTLANRAEKDRVGEVGLVLTVHDSQVLLLPDDQFGQDLASQCAQFGRNLWKQMFPGIPGDVDDHSWVKTA